jgi:hypothetical protein
MVTLTMLAVSAKVPIERRSGASAVEARESTVGTLADSTQRAIRRPRICRLGLTMNGRSSRLRCAIRRC